MKKTALLLIFIFALTMIFASCRSDSQKDQGVKPDPEPTTFEELWQLVDKKMNDMRSYRVDIDTKISVELNGVKISGDIDVQTVVIGEPDDEDFYTYEHSKSVMVVDGNISNKIESLISYIDGKMYVYNKLDSSESRIYSEISPADFCSFYLSRSGSDFDMSPESAQSKTMKKNDDGTWELSYSNFDTSTLAKILKDLDFTEEYLGFAINNIAIKVTADQNYKVTNLQLDFSTEHSDEPAITMLSKYSEHDNAKRIEFDKAEYTEVDDARIVDVLNTHMRETANKENGSFVLVADQKITDLSGNKTLSKYKETDNVSYSNKGGVFNYNIGADANGQKISIEYYLGTQTIIANGKTQTAKQSADEARTFIQSLINPTGYNTACVKDVIVTDDGKYRIEIKSGKAYEYTQTMTSLGDTLEEYEIYITVDKIGDDIVKVETNILLIGKQYKVYVDNVITYEQETN